MCLSSLVRQIHSSARTLNIGRTLTRPGCRSRLAHNYSPNTSLHPPLLLLQYPHFKLRNNSHNLHLIPSSPPLLPPQAPKRPSLLNTSPNIRSNRPRNTTIIFDPVTNLATSITTTIYRVGKLEAVHSFIFHIGV